MARAESGASAPAVEELARRAEEEQFVSRIWERDATLWAPRGTPEVANRLGWLDSPAAAREARAELESFRDQCRGEGLTDAVVLGMGGSSLAPEVFRRSFPAADGALRLHVLDSTDSGAVLSLERAVDLRRTLFLVSTKSGGTIETLSLYRYFRSRLDLVLGEAAGRSFAAITDPGSSLGSLAGEEGFRRTFLNDPDIGGRYSALSYFGLVPAALAGVDLDALLASASRAERDCRSTGARNPGLQLGLRLGEAATRGRDKLTLFPVDESVGAFGLWVEQLVAESTGKAGKGILPVVDEPPGAPERYGPDRLFEAILRSADPQGDTRLIALLAAGHEAAWEAIAGAEDLGALFFVWEFATAVAGWVLGINPFDQPNVQEAKDRTSAVLEGYAREGTLPDVAEADDAALGALVAQLEPPAYLAVMGYLEPSAAVDAAVGRLRAAVRDARGVATTFGYGPRFLHSTGQLHKGGPPTGCFLQLVHDGPEDVEVPGAGYSFTTLKGAQATGDLEALRAKGRPAERVRLQGDPAAALQRLTTRLEEML